MRPILTQIGSLPPYGGDPEESLKAAVAMQRAHGIELLTDGEQRGDMLSPYVEIPGIQEGRGVPRITGRIRPMGDPAGFTKVRDLDRLKSLYPGVAFKVSLTGPATFLLACAASGAGPSYRGPMDSSLHDDLTEALRPLARELGRRGANLQIDEPILSQGMKDYRPELDRLDLLASELPRDRMSVHVCGGLARTKALEALFRLEAFSVLSLAFAGKAERENRTLLEPRSWEDHDIRLGAGSIDVQVSGREEVMKPSEVAALLREISRAAGPEHLAFVLPDCGLRATSPDLVPLLLENLHRGFETAFPRDA